MTLPATEHWFSFHARRNRKSYIVASMMLTAIMVCVLLVLWFFDARQRSFIVVFLLFLVPYVVCIYSLTSQRLRDMGQTGWLALLWIPVGITDRYIGGAASLAFSIVLCVVPGTAGENRYGPDPLRFGG
ncbi:DUF805 domain-containing protein [Rhizobium rhizogenes]|uniref:DUF805 domain-containing protein n=1 Tax=Rhizobium rhizogenes TaxID=359 RepID=UPI00193D8746|nr:DUF805 domain-containing protein [Rhizobium rhizogenes]QRM39474.1 DUF805 domain-containing protein [Rhizobium rhizogenes]